MSAMPLVLLSLFIALPLCEIALFILVGGQIGVLATIAIVVLTAIAGATLVRRQGLATLQRARADFDAGRIPAGPMAEGLAILFAGVLLLTPGFLTDAIGFALLIPALRARLVTAVGGWLVRHAIVIGPDGMMQRAADRRSGARYGPDIIELDACEIDDTDRTGAGNGQPRAPSPWRERKG
ncbi:UPF0716 protein FxsA [Tepidamorphus gemmatus]|uniref:UPF0716 protein FxsA n=1 Tax=Tepidamorphus gemmatus TaxID=747076 RepID=A0A4R3MJH9_9HYPH|nr:FxsA family protein [Tepidamorphus gemmatus]TCT11905.1 UPF0716 protein FxsA [Tepidamorphus gemmatus]